MITLNIEIRYTNSLHGAFSYTAIKKEKVLAEILDLALEVIWKMYPKKAPRSLVVIPSKKWDKLSKTLYSVKEYDGAPSIIFVKTKRKINLPQAEMIQVSLLTDRESSDNPLTIDIKNG